MRRSSTWIDFETSRRELLFESLDRYLDHENAGISAESYILTCEALGDIPDMNKLPPVLSDFPDYVIDSLNIYNILPDRYSGGMGSIYTGKELGALKVLFEVYDVSKEYHKLCLDVIAHVDHRARVKSINAAKAAAKKTK